MKKQFYFLTIIFVITFCSYGWATHYRVGTSGAQSLEMGMGVRATGMGGAFCAIADNSDAIYWNPAGLGQLWKTEICAGQYKWVEDIDYNFINFVYPLLGLRASNVDELGAFGASLVLLNSGNIPGRDILGNTTSNFKVEDRIIVLSYGKKILKDTFFGVSGKHIKQEIQVEKEGAYAFDMGMLYYPRETGISLGITFQNMGNNYEFLGQEDSLPFNIKMGIAGRVLDDKLLLAADFNKPKYSNYYTNIGTEWEIDKVFKLRLGYDSDVDVGNGISMGLGIGLKEVDIYFMPIAEVNFDYAFVDYGDLGVTHRIAITLKFGTE